MNRFYEKYKKEIIKKMQDEFKYSNLLQTPKLNKVVISVGIGDTSGKQGMMEKVIENIKIITGQKPIITLAKQSIAGFKIREGEKVGLTVTLRSAKMYDFIDRLVTISLPRIRDFRGLSNKSFDGHGNFSLGLKEQTLFTEIPYDTIEYIHGLQININTTAKTDAEAKSLLANFGFPFQKIAETKSKTSVESKEK